MEWTIEKETELESIADFVIDKVLSKKDLSAKVIGLYGNLGAGKTAFTKVLVRKLGGNEHVVSPTFILQKTYDVSNSLGFTSLSHIDAYRFEDEKEALVLKVPEGLIDPSHIYVIEWPENMGALVPAHTKILFEHLGGDTRKIKIIV